MRMGIRFAGTLMHRCLKVAAISDGYRISDEPHRATVTWGSSSLRDQHETDLVEAAQRFRSTTTAEGPIDTDLLIADFLFMLVQRAGELAFHADFAMGARRTERRAVEEDIEGDATWIFGSGAADALDTVRSEPGSSISPSGQLVGWPDGTIYVVDPGGEAFEVSNDPELVALLINRARRKRVQADRSR